MRNIAIIPARSGSKGLLNKNIRELNGKPLMAYSVEAAINSGCFDTVMVSTDSEQYAEIARVYGAEVPFLRSEATASDTASSWDAVEDVLQGYENLRKGFDTFCLLQPTSPMRTAEDIKNAYELFDEKSAIAVLSMTELDHPIEWCGKISDTLSLDGFNTTVDEGRRQDMGRSYRPNGAIYIVSVSEFRKDRNLYRSGAYAYIMPKERSVDIDSEYDFRLAEFLYAPKHFADGSNHIISGDMISQGDILKCDSLSNDKRSRVSDTPFQLIEGDPLIACVGNNGGTSDYDIFEGFAKAVSVIYASVAQNKVYEDAMVYPMAFSARHGIELGLKISIRELMNFINLDKLDGRIQDLDRNHIEKVLNDHNIKELHDSFVMLLSIDRRLSLYETQMTPYLSDYYFDEKGDMFRYAESREDIPNLASQNIYHVSLTQLYNRFLKLFKSFERFYSEIEILYREYKTGSYTKNLSRKEIKDIAGRLPDKSNWLEEGFDDLKNAIKSEYAISGHELSDVINIIRKVPEFSAMIGEEIKYKDISDDELDSYWKLVKWYNSRENYISDTISVCGITVENISSVQKNLKGTSEYAKGISTETLNMLLTFYLIADEGAYVEDIDKYFDYVDKNKYNRNYLIRKLAKAEAFHFVKTGMEMCGQKSYLKRIDF